MEEKVLGTAIGALVGAGRRSNNFNTPRSTRRRASAKPKRRVSFDPNARDADKDKLVQEGTTQERRVGSQKPGGAVRRAPKAEVNKLEGRPKVQRAAPRQRKPKEGVLPPAARRRTGDPKRQVVAKPEQEPAKPRVLGRRRPEDRKPKVGVLPPAARPKKPNEAVVRKPKPEADVAAPEKPKVQRPAARPKKPKVGNLPPAARRREDDPNRVVAGKRPVKRPAPDVVPPVENDMPGRRGEDRSGNRPTGDFMQRLDDLAIRIVPENAVMVKRGGISGLRSRDLSPDEEQAFKDIVGPYDQHLAAVKPSWNDRDYMVGKADELSQSAKATADKANELAKSIRARRYNDQSGVRRDQFKYLVLREKILREQAAATAIYSRVENLDKVESIKNDLRAIEDRNGDPYDRVALLDAFDGRLSLLPGESGGDYDEYAGNDAFRQEARGRVDAVKDEVRQELVKVNGPVDYEDLVADLNPAQGRLNQRIDQAIAAFDGDSTELKNFRDELKDIQDALGPEVRPKRGPEGDADRAANTARRWSAAKIRQINKTINETDLLEPFDYGPARPRPEVIGEIADESGPRFITSRNITSAQEAIDHIKNGGTMSDVPNAFWAAAMIGNSSIQEVDKNSKFQVIAPGEGAIGLTRLIFARDENGVATKSGWVIKADQDKTTAAEVFSQQLMIEHGLPVEGAGWDGTVGSTNLMGGKDRGEVFAVLPLAFNGMEDGKINKGRESYGSAVFDQLDDKGVDVRLASFLHNFMLAVPDRHKGNGIATVVNGKAYAIPIDQGWSMKYGTEDLFNYAGGFGMDRNLHETIRTTMAGANAEVRAKIKQNVEQVYDGFIERASKIVAGGEDAFVAKVGGDPRNLNPETARHARKLYGVYRQNLDNLKTNRDRFMKMAGLA